MSEIGVSFAFISKPFIISKSEKKSRTFMSIFMSACHAYIYICTLMKKNWHYCRIVYSRKWVLTCIILHHPHQSGSPEETWLQELKHESRCCLFSTPKKNHHRFIHFIIKLDRCLKIGDSCKAPKPSSVPSSQLNHQLKKPNMIHVLHMYYTEFMYLFVHCVKHWSWNCTVYLLDSSVLWWVGI